MLTTEETAFDSFPTDINEIQLLYYNVSIITIYYSLRVSDRGLYFFFFSYQF